MKAERRVNVLTEDGIVKIGNSGEWIGRDQIYEYRRESFALRPADYAYRHWNSSTTTSISRPPTGGGSSSDTRTRIPRLRVEGPVGQVRRRTGSQLNVSQP